MSAIGAVGRLEDADLTIGTDFSSLPMEGQARLRRAHLWVVGILLGVPKIAADHADVAQRQSVTFPGESEGSTPSVRSIPKENPAGGDGGASLHKTAGRGAGKKPPSCPLVELRRRRFSAPQQCPNSSTGAGKPSNIISYAWGHASLRKGCVRFPMTQCMIDLGEEGRHP